MDWGWQHVPIGTAAWQRQGLCAESRRLVSDPLLTPRLRLAALLAALLVVPLPASAAPQALYERALEQRILLQRCLQASNGLPRPDTHAALVGTQPEVREG